jgi:hypothetical protein
MNIDFVVAPDGVNFIPSFVNIVQNFETYKLGYTQTQRQVDAQLIFFLDEGTWAMNGSCCKRIFQ